MTFLVPVGKKVYTGSGNIIEWTLDNGRIVGVKDTECAWRCDGEFLGT